MNKFKLLADLFRDLDEEIPDKSTEFLMQMTCDRAWIMYKIRCDAGDVAEALFKDQKESK